MKGHTYISKPVDEFQRVQWSEVENQTWAHLVSRQRNIIQNRACDEFIKGLDILNFPKDRVVQIPEVNEVLQGLTGWGVEPVPAIIPPKEFFTLLAKKRFPAATFIRIPEEMDYLQEPDIFHEIYGHTPLLTNQNYCDFMQHFGELALRAQPKDRFRLFRLFWFTIEFGLINTPQGLRAYGGGILSSIGETQYCLTDENKKIPFDTLTALRTPYRIDIMQPVYFVINDLRDLFNIAQQDILALVEESKRLGDFPPSFPPKEASEDQQQEEGDMRCC
jgi:phenylalanine-4-hydroxylase